MAKTYWHVDERAKGDGFWVTSTKTRAKAKKEFAIVPLPAAAAMLKAMRKNNAMVVIALFYLAWKHKGAPFPFSNIWLAKYGIRRETKRRMLRKLEQAGFIKVEQQGNQAPIVTLLQK